MVQKMIIFIDINVKFHRTGDIEVLLENVIEVLTSFIKFSKNLRNL